MRIAFEQAADLAIETLAIEWPAGVEDPVLQAFQSGLDAPRKPFMQCLLLGLAILRTTQ